MTVKKAAVPKVPAIEVPGTNGTARRLHSDGKKRHDRSAVKKAQELKMRKKTK
jgi:hypothetical protein